MPVIYLNQSFIFYTDFTVMQFIYLSQGNTSMISNYFKV